MKFGIYLVRLVSHSHITSGVRMMTSSIVTSRRALVFEAQWPTGTAQQSITYKLEGKTSDIRLKSVMGINEVFL